MFPEGGPLGKTFEDGDGDRWQVVGIIDTFYNPYAWNIGEYVDLLPAAAGQLRQAARSYLVRVKPGQLDGGREGDRADAGRRQRQPHLPRAHHPRRQAPFLGSQTLLVRLLSLVIVVLVFVTGARHHGADVVLGRRADAPDRHPPRPRRRIAATSCGTS